MAETYVWRILNSITLQYETDVSAVEPTIAPSNGAPAVPGFTTIMQSEFYDITNPGYINIESQLADNQAIKIQASDPNGGIDIDAGFGGIAIDTTNSLSINAGAASDFTVTNGNLHLNATTGLANLDGNSGINIGNTTNAGPVNISTALQRTVNIGNSIGSTNVAIQSGTGGLSVSTNNGPIGLFANGAASNFSVTTNANGQDLTLALLGSTDSSVQIVSQGTNTDAIYLNSIGGITMVSNTQPVTIVSNNNVGNAISLDTFGGGGGIIISSGSFGIGINSNGGALGIGHFSGGDIYFATAAVARNIFMGNVATNTNLYNRYGTAKITTQPNEFAIPVSAIVNLTVANLLAGILHGTPSPTTLTLPTPVTIIGSIPNLIINDSLDFTIINQSASATYTIDAGTQNIIGSAIINPLTSASFRIKILNIFVGTEAYIVYRI